MLITPTGVKGLRYVFVKPEFLDQDRPDLCEKAIILLALLLIKSVLKLHEEHC